MPLTTTVSLLEGLVEDRRLVGWVAGVHRGGATHVLAGGSRGIDGPEMTTDSLFALTSNTKPIAGALALALVERGVLQMADPVDEWLPELAAMQVLVRPDAPLDQTVPARRSITLHDLLTMTPGFGAVAEEGPLQRAMVELQVAPSGLAPAMRPEKYMRRLGSLPLANQPGERWRYHTSSDVLGVLLSRATGRPVAQLLEEYVTGPLGMDDTRFTGEPARLTVVHQETADGSLAPLDLGGRTLTTAPEFESLACGLVSTVDDYLKFLRALANDGAPILSPESALAMRTDQLTPQQREGTIGTLDEGSGWGHHVEVRPDGSIGWAGGFGTIGYANPRTGRAAALFIPQTLATAGVRRTADEFWGLLDQP